ncbi:MAG: sortase [Clostridiales bacterium]|nr:sortase [Clostridiales bacterium]
MQIRGKLTARLTALILAAAILALTGCGGCSLTPGRDDHSLVTPSPDAETPSPTEEHLPDIEDPEWAANPAPERSAFVVTGENGTFGVADDGSVRFIGRAVSGQNYIRDWHDIRRLAANDICAAALTGEGKLLFTGKGGVNPFPKAEEWEDIVDIKLGCGFIIGLKSDGTAVAADVNGELDLPFDSRVKAIDAAGDHYAILTDVAGAYISTGGGINADINEHPVKALAAAPDHIAVLGTDGRVRTYELPLGKEKEPFSRSDFVKVFAAEGATYAVTADGQLFTDASFVPAGLTGVYCVSAKKAHAVVLFGDGSVRGFGDNSDMRLAVDGWRLLPYVTEEGWLLGLYPGRLIDGKSVYTGMNVVWADPATGETSAAVCVLLGDVNGDGRIDLDDLSAAKQHMAGETALTGAYLRAANVIRDDEEPDRVDVSDIDLIAKEAGEPGSIDQYAKTDMYTTPLAVSRRVNPDATGYITLPNTNISYPILFAPDWFYSSHGIDGKPRTSGCIHYYTATPNGNIVLAGHNARTSGTMFHQLHFIQDRSEELNEYENRLWYINVYGESGWWEVWAMYEEGAFPRDSMSSRLYNLCWPATYDAKNDEERQAWIDYQLERNQLGYTVEVGLGDRFMTLYTCGDTHQDSEKGAALYFFLRWVGRN